MLKAHIILKHQNDVLILEKIAEEQILKLNALNKFNTIDISINSFVDQQNRIIAVVTTENATVLFSLGCRFGQKMQEIEQLKTVHNG